VEASLLPSTEIRALSQRVILVVVKRADARCAKLRTEFGVATGNSWVVVLDTKGETLASWIGDAAGAACDERTADRFARNLVSGIDESLRRTETEQELERRWKKNRSDTAAFERFSERLKEALAFPRLRQICHEAAANPALAKDVRSQFKLSEFIARGLDSSGHLLTQNWRAAWIREGEELLVNLASHSNATELVGAMFSTGYAHGFDVPARAARAIARLRRRAGKLDDPTHLTKCICALAKCRAEWIGQMKTHLDGVEDMSAEKYLDLTASLGDAQAAIDLYSRTPFSDSPHAQEWLRCAKAKIQEQSARTKSHPRAACRSQNVASTDAANTE
jgi:hypothetical protein